MISVDDSKSGLMPTDETVKPLELFANFISQVLFRRELVKTIQESEGKYRSLIESSEDPIYLIDKNLNYLHANKKLLSWYGKPLEKIIGQNYSKFHSPEQTIKFSTKVEQVLKCGKPTFYEHESKIDKRHFLRTLSPVIDQKTGKTTAVTVYSKDITNLKKIEKELKQRVTQAAMIYKVGQQISSELELSTLLTEIVKTVCKTFNYYNVMLFLFDKERNCLASESIAGGYANIFSKDYRIPIGKGMIGRAAEIGETQVSGDVRHNPYYIRGGVEKTKSELAVPILSGENIIGVLDIQSDKFNCFNDTDVTAMKTLSSQIASALENAQLYESIQKELKERIKVETALKESEENYRSLAQNAFDGIVINNEEGDYVYVNKKSVELTGYSIKELLNLNIKDLTPPRYIEKVLNRSKRRIKGEPAENFFEATLIRKDGVELPIEVTATRTIWQEKPADIVFLRDITQRKILEKETLKVQKLESTGILAGGIAHDFNNILTAILGNITLAKMYAKPEDKVYDRLGKAENACMRAKDLT